LLVTAIIEHSHMALYVQHQNATKSFLAWLHSWYSILEHSIICKTWNKF